MLAKFSPAASGQCQVVWAAQSLGPFLLTAHGDALFVWAAIKNLQGGDFIFVVFDEFLEGFHQNAAGRDHLSTPGHQDLILADVINDLLERPFSGTNRWRSLELVAMVVRASNNAWLP